MNSYPKRADSWSTEHTRRAAQLLAVKASNATFLKEIGRSKKAAREHLRYLKANGHGPKDQ